MVIAQTHVKHNIYNRYHSSIFQTRQHRSQQPTKLAAYNQRVIIGLWWVWKGDREIRLEANSQGVREEGHSGECHRELRSNQVIIHLGAIAGNLHQRF